MIIESLEALYRKQADERPPNNPWRASSAGRCIREGCFDLLGLKGKPLQPRRMAVFKHGDMIHDALKKDIKKALGWRFVEEQEWHTEPHHECFVEIDGAKISYHIDGAFQSDVYSPPDMPGLMFQNIGILEIKSMSDYAFNRALKGEIDDVYLAQAWVYFKGTDFNPVVFLCYRKETSAMVEIVFDRSVHEKVVTQRLTGDAIELAKVDPILLTEIKSPFDEAVGEYVRERIAWLQCIERLRGEGHRTDLIAYVTHNVPGKDAVEDEVESVQGKDAYARRIEELKLDIEPVKAGSWYKFKTGRKILGFP